jgi:hypothetical protein
MKKLYPTCKFQHYDWKFDPKSPVEADHPMVALRPDLFTPDAPAASKKSPPKE